MRLQTTKSYKNTKKINFVLLYRFVFRRQLAISLYELIIVLAIIGILTAVTIPTVRNYLPFWQLTGSARALVGNLRQAQEEAVTSQKQHRINFTSTEAPVTYQLVKVEIDDLGSEILTILETVNMPNNISVEFETITNPITFSADGGPSTNGNIIINLGSASKTINISPAGVIKLQ